LSIVTPGTSNLFAIDYLKEHSPTISEFKTIWDTSPSETKNVCVDGGLFLCSIFGQKYDTLSKEKKAGSRLAATTTHSSRPLRYELGEGAQEKTGRENQESLDSAVVQLNSEVVG
jgi:hypothetical protein